MVDRDGVIESPEEEADETAADHNLREARKGLFIALLTPVWWVAGFPIMDLVAYRYPGLHEEYWYQGLLNFTWILFALVMPIAAGWGGLKLSQTIRDSGDLSGLRMARTAGILGVIFTPISILLVIGFLLG